MASRTAAGVDLRAARLAPPGVRATPEADFQRAVVDLARALGWWCWHDHDSRRNPAGLPDLLLARAGVLLAAELKTGRRCTTPEQRETLRTLGEVPGVLALLWRPDASPNAERWDGILETAEPDGRTMGAIERRLVNAGVRGM